MKCIHIISWIFTRDNTIFHAEYEPNEKSNYFFSDFMKGPSRQHKENITSEQTS